MEIEAGQWYRNGAGHIVFCLAKNPYTTDYPWVMISHNGYDTEVESYQIDGTYSSSPYLEGIEDLEDWNIVEHLPDCTGFDWVPKPKLQLREGAWYRRKDGKIVGPCEPSTSREDRFWTVAGYFYTHDGTNTHPSLTLEEEVSDPTPKPVYRPFANAAEFAPHRDRWLLSGSERLKVIWYSDVSLCSTKFWCWKEAFHKFTFEDGTPFGVKVS
jgi:hypothetical protein